MVVAPDDADAEPPGEDPVEAELRALEEEHAAGSESDAPIHASDMSDCPGEGATGAAEEDAASGSGAA